jgi:hypothetical protein
MSKPFSSYNGVFLCKRCGEEVSSLRLWHDTLDLTWQCSKKHITKVNADPRNKKYDREK